MAARPWSSDKLFEAAFEILNSVVQGTIGAEESAKFKAWMQLSSEIANFYPSGTELDVDRKKIFDAIISKFRDDKNLIKETKAKVYKGTLTHKLKEFLVLLFEAGLELAGCVLYEGTSNKTKCPPLLVRQATTYVLQKLLPKSTPETQANNKCELSRVSCLETVPRPADAPSSEIQRERHANLRFASNHINSKLANPALDGTLPILSPGTTNGHPNEHSNEHSNAYSNAYSNEHSNAYPNAQKKRKLDDSTYHPETAPLVTSEAQPYQNSILDGPKQIVDRFLINALQGSTFPAIIRASWICQLAIKGQWDTRSLCLSIMKIEGCTDWIITAQCTPILPETYDGAGMMYREFVPSFLGLMTNATTQSIGWQTEIKEGVNVAYTNCINVYPTEQGIQVQVRVAEKWGEALANAGVISV